LRRRLRSVPWGSIGGDPRTSSARRAHPQIRIGLVPRKEVIAAVLTKLTILARSVLVSDDDGQGLAEYALIVALLFLGTQISDKLTVISNEL
jgi:hypothetical protein